MTTKEAGRVLGYGPCPNCGKDATPYKINKKGHLYVYCVTEGDGGCNSGSQSRSHSGDVHKARKIKKWVHPEDRSKYLSDEPEQKTAETTVKKPWYEAEIL